jgi:ABC-2 type transport system permease protein
MNALTGTRALIRLILRRDRILLPLWIILVGLVPISMASSLAALYPTAEELRAYAHESMSTPAAVGMLGRVYEASLGGLVAWRSGLNSAS